MKILRIYLEDHVLIKCYRIEHSILLKIQNMIDTKEFLRSVNKKSSGSGVKNEITPNQELADDLSKPIIRKFEKGK